MLQANELLWSLRVMMMLHSMTQRTNISLFVPRWFCGGQKWRGGGICNPRKPVFSHKRLKKTPIPRILIQRPLRPTPPYSLPFLPLLLLCATWRLCCGKISQNRDKNCVRSPASFMSLRSWRLERGDRGGRTRTFSRPPTPRVGLRSSYCRIFPRPPS